MPLRHAVFLACAFATAINFVRSNWAYQAFEVVIFLIAAVWAVSAALRRPSVRFRWIAGLFFLLPLWGILQLALGWTVYPGATLIGVMHWLSLAAVFLLASQFSAHESERRAFLDWFGWFGAGLAVLCLLQLFTSQGKVLWLFPTDFDIVFATFPSYNNWAQFVELALPIALWRAAQPSGTNLAWALAAAVMYGSVIASTSRAGTALCTAEVLLALLLISRRHLRDWRTAAVRVLALILLAGGLIMVVGWERLTVRFAQDNPFAGRREIAQSAIAMIKDRPWVGYGLNTFPSVYPKYALFDDGKRMNAAHNDYLEYAATGGLFFAVFLFVPIVYLWPAAIRSVWGIGIVAILLHAFVDFPLQRPGVAAWIFALLAAINERRLQAHPPRS